MQSWLEKTAGFFLGLAGASFFGFIPVFAIPLLHGGYSVETIALYRFGLAALALSPFLAFSWRKVSLRVGLGAMAAGIFYFLDVIFFFHALKYLSGGIVATLEFLCPVFTVALMIAFFHEKFHWRTGLSIILAMAGVALISLSPSGVANSGEMWLGVALSLMAAFCNALYYIAFKWIAAEQMDALATTFLVMLSCSLLCLGNGAITGSLRWMAQGWPLLYAILLALVTAILSNLCLVAAIKRIGPASVSILGVMEPVTATLAGLALLDEPVSTAIIAGLICSILAVLLTVRAN